MKKNEIYMQLGDEKESEEEQKSIVKNLAKKEMKDEALESLIGDMQIFDITGGMATVAMPIEVIKLLSSFFKKLEQGIEEGISK